MPTGSPFLGSTPSLHSARSVWCACAPTPPPTWTIWSRSVRRSPVSRRPATTGVPMFEAKHDPFVLLVLASGTTVRMGLGTAVAIAFARNPMTLANVGYDLQVVSGGRFAQGLGSQIRPHIVNRYSSVWSHPAARMREMVRRSTRSGTRGRRASRCASRASSTATPSDADVRPRAQPARPAARVHRGVRAPHGRDHRESPTACSCTC